MSKRFLFLFVVALVSVTAWSLGPGIQGELKKKVEEPKAVEVGVHDSSARLKVICGKLALSEDQMKQVKSLYSEFTAKFKSVESDKFMKPKERERLLENLHDNADRRFRNLLNKTQKGTLEELLMKEQASYKMAKANAKAPEKGAPAVAAPAAAAGGKICWSCWPGKCDRGRWWD